MNKQLLSTIIIWIFVLPSLWGLHSTKITTNTSLYKIEGVIEKFECKKKNKRLNGEVAIYYGIDKKISFQDNLLKENNFDTRCKELTNLINKGMKFKIITIDTFNKVLSLEVNSKKILDFNEEVEAFNHRNVVFFNIALFIGIIMTIGNLLIWYYKGNPDKWVKSSWFQGILYFVAIMAIIRYL